MSEMNGSITGDSPGLGQGATDRATLAAWPSSISTI
jgi:hypothetical protein